jgi:hypothetical protein
VLRAGQGHGHDDKCARLDLRSRHSTRISTGSALIQPDGRAGQHAIREIDAHLSQRDLSCASSRMTKLDAPRSGPNASAIQILALRAPMAGDLRDIVAAM